jgi:hypothetical protein
MTEEEKDIKFDHLLQDLSVDGHWNMELADCMPLAIANLYKQPIRIYSSMVSNSVYDIYPDLQDATMNPAKLSYVSFPIFFLSFRFSKKLLLDRTFVICTFSWCK